MSKTTFTQIRPYLAVSATVVEASQHLCQEGKRLLHGMGDICMVGKGGASELSDHTLHCLNCKPEAYPFHVVSRQIRQRHVVVGVE